jgi:hypothetical protein
MDVSPPADPSDEEWNPPEANGAQWCGGSRVSVGSAPLVGSRGLRFYDAVDDAVTRGRARVVLTELRCALPVGWNRFLHFAIHFF